MRARSVPLVPSALRGAPASYRVTPGTLGEGLGGGRQEERIDPAPLRAPPGYLGLFPKPLRARKFTPEQAEGEVGGAQVQSREPSGLDSAPFSPLVPSRSPFSLSIWSWKGGHYKWRPPESPTAPFPVRRWSGCPQHQGPAGEEVREFTSELTQASRDFRAAKHGVNLDTRPRLSPRGPPMGTFEP